MSLLDKMLLPSFGSVAFPVQKVDIKGSLRHFVHEYLYTPGGEIEVFGRKLYEISMDGVFHDTFRRWPKLYESLTTLVVMFDTGGTYDLVVPNIGLIPVKCINWKRSLVASIRSGESVSLEFLEHRQEPFLTTNVLIPSTGNLADAYRDFLIAYDMAGGDPDLLDALSDAVNQIGAVGDQAELFTDQLAAKAESVSAMCESLYDSVPFFDSSDNHAVSAQFRDVWSQSDAIAKDSQKQGKPIVTTTTPKVMGVNEVSRLIFGTTEKAVELMRMNGLATPLNIPAGTAIRHYAK